MKKCKLCGETSILSVGNTPLCDKCWFNLDCCGLEKL